MQFKQTATSESAHQEQQHIWIAHRLNGVLSLFPVSELLMSTDRRPPYVYKAPGKSSGVTVKRTDFSVEVRKHHLI